MSIGLLFWIVYLVSVLLYSVLNWPFNRVSGAGFVVFLLIFLLGWHSFGFIVHD